MTRWICKLTKSNGQYRLTIPIGLVKEKGLAGVQYIEIDGSKPDVIIIRRLTENGKKAVNGKTDINGED